MPVRAATLEVLTRARAALDADARAAAGNNQLSKSEQEALAPGVLQDAAIAVRARDGRVSVASLVIEADQRLTALLGGVNTRGPSAVSQDEVRALHGAHADAGVRVARAYELITGKHIDLPGLVATPVPPPVAPPPAPGVVPIQGFTQTPAPVMPYAGPTVLLPNGALQLVRGAALPSTFTLDVAGQTFTATVDRSSGQLGNVATTADVVEAIRRAVAPAYDLEVRQHDSNGTIIALHGATAPRHTGAPTYLYAEGKSFELRGPLRFVLNRNEVLQPGESVRLRIDDKLYTATATRSNTSIQTLVRDLRDQAVADGRTIDLREYTNYAPWTFIVTG